MYLISESKTFLFAQWGFFLDLEVFIKWLIVLNFVGLLKLWLSWKCLQAIFSSTFFISFQWLLKFSPTCHSSHTEKSHFKVPLQPVTEKIMCKKLYRTVKTENKLYYGTKCFLYNFLSCFLCLHMNILEIKFQSEECWKFLSQCFFEKNILILADVINLQIENQFLD